MASARATRRKYRSSAGVAESGSRPIWLIPSSLSQRTGWYRSWARAWQVGEQKTASLQCWQGIGGLWDDRGGMGELHVSQREAWRARVAVRAERSRRMGVLGGKGLVAKRPSCRHVGGVASVVVVVMMGRDE